MTSRVIKNPNRGKKKYRQDLYRPEHVRLNMPPKVESGILNTGKNLSVPKNVLQGIGEINNSSSFLHRREIPFSKKDWYPSEEENQEQLEKEINEIEFREEENNLDSEKSEFPLPEYLTLEDLFNFEISYLIYVSGQEVFFKASSQEEAEKIVEKFIFSKDSPFSHLKLENFLILKNLDLKFGISAK